VAIKDSRQRIARQHRRQTESHGGSQKLGSAKLRELVANIKSQIKRVGTNEQRRQRNVAARSEVKTRIKTARSVADTFDDVGGEYLRQAVKAIDKAAARGIIHRNQAANRKSALMRRFAVGASTAEHPPSRDTSALTLGRLGETQRVMPGPAEGALLLKDPTEAIEAAFRETLLELFPKTDPKTLERPAPRTDDERTQIFVDIEAGLRQRGNQE
jgi:small subunit ribosomal protein S20